MRPAKSPRYRDHRAPTLPAFVQMKLALETQPGLQMSVSIEVPFGQQNLTVRWPSSDPDGSPGYPGARKVIRIDAMWLATEPINMRADIGQRRRGGFIFPKPTVDCVRWALPLCRTRSYSRQLLLF